jgi:hypothetical protein
MTTSPEPSDRTPIPVSNGRRVGTIAALLVAVPVILLDWAFTLSIVLGPRTAGSTIDVAQVLVQPSLITLGGVFMVLLAGRLGESLSRRIAERPDIPAPLFGVVAGLSLLLATALVAGVLGLIAGWSEQRSLVRAMGAGFRVSLDAREFVMSYGFKPAAVLAVYGWPVAAIAGAISGVFVKRAATRARSEA